MKWVGKSHSGCTLCKIAKGESISKVLFKNKNIIVIMNIFPYNTGHLQVMPIRHVSTLDELSDDEIFELFRMVKRCVRLISKVLKPEGFNIGMNIGEFSGASIADHLHIHIVPRYKTDFGFMEILAETKVMPEKLEETYKRLMKHAKILSE